MPFFYVIRDQIPGYSPFPDGTRSRVFSLANSSCSMRPSQISSLNGACKLSKGHPFRMLELSGAVRVFLSSGDNADNSFLLIAS
jgi:hypothetical protein